MSSPQRRRVAAALGCSPVDQVPLGELFVEDGLVAALAGRELTGPVDFATRRTVLEALHLDAVGAYPGLPDGRPMLGVHLAAARRGRGWSPTGGPTAASRLGLPEPVALSWRPLREWSSDSPFFVVAVLPGPFGELAYLEGIERFLVRAWRRPDEARHLAESMVDYGLELATLASEAGAQGFVIGEDVAWEKGLLLRAAVYRELFLPALRREVEGLRSLGAPVLFHSDGDVTALMDDLVSLGLDGLHGESAAAVRSLGVPPDGSPARLCRWGNLDLDVLASWPTERFADEVGAAFSSGSSMPGYLFGSSAGVLDATLPAEAVRAAFDAAHALAPGGPARRQARGTARLS